MLALALAYNGAKGATERAMSEALGLSGLSLEEVNAANAALLAMKGDLEPRIQLVVANAIWARQGITLAADFLRRIKSSYGSEANTLDFSAPTASATINKWVADQTEQKIQVLVTQDVVNQAVLLLTNAIYFRGQWTTSFNKAETKEGTFTLLNGTQQRHPMMTQSGSYDYFENQTFQGVSLPYGEGRVSMYILLPKPDLTINELQKDLSLENWQKWMAKFRQMEGRIVLPRFKIEYSTELKDALIALGMDEAFGPHADLQGMGTGALVLSQVYHKTYLEVNEEGTIAAATTAAVMGRSLAPRKFMMSVDRPFFVAIRDNVTGVVLFMGFVIEPK
jgi:serpin B